MQPKLVSDLIQKNFVFFVCINSVIYIPGIVYCLFQKLTFCFHEKNIRLIWFLHYADNLFK